MIRRTPRTKQAKTLFTYTTLFRSLFKQKGIVVDTIELEFVVRPTKTLPCRHFTFSEAVTEDNMAMIEGQLNLIAHSVKVWKEQPELRYLLAQDYRLKLPDRPKTFKNTN